jgi:hypothetical protein
LARKTYVRTPVIASSSLSSCKERWAGEEHGCGGERAAKASEERAAKASGMSGGGGRESAGIVDLSSEEPNMNGACNCV